MSQEIAEAILETLSSENVDDQNGEIANVVDVLDKCARAGRLIAHAITANVAGGRDSSGGHVECLTEAVMGMTAALNNIASALACIAEAIESHGN